MIGTWGSIVKIDVAPYLPTGAYNAELVKQLSTDMRVKIGTYRAPVQE